MIRLAISVEGKTEEEFVKVVLAEHLRAKGVEPQPFLIGTGGNVTVNRLTSDMAKLYWSFDAVTSLVDFYGFRDKADRSVERLERHLLKEVRDRIHRRREWDETKVFPYVQRHEFEGLLFSDVNAFPSVMDVPEESVLRLRRIRSQFSTPEDINDEAETAPSKRIARTILMYRKALHGPLIAKNDWPGRHPRGSVLVSIGGLSAWNPCPDRAGGSRSTWVWRFRIAVSREFLALGGAEDASAAGLACQTVLGDNGHDGRNEQEADHGGRDVPRRSAADPRVGRGPPGSGRATGRSRIS